MENNGVNVPYIAHEGAMVRLERINKRLWILAITLIVILGLSNGAWIVYESQYETRTELEQDIDTGEGDATVIGIGDYNGTNKTKDN